MSLKLLFLGNCTILISDVKQVRKLFLSACLLLYVHSTIVPLGLRDWETSKAKTLCVFLRTSTTEYLESKIICTSELNISWKNISMRTGYKHLVPGVRTR